VITATGVSCRQQVSHGAGRAAIHPLTFARSCVASPGSPEPPRSSR
jgi:hypothetical protein